MSRPRHTWSTVLSGGRKPQVGDWLWADARLIVLARARDRCEHCGRRPDQGHPLDVHHIVPFREGGQTTIDNLMALCHGCHMAEHARMRRAEQDSAEAPSLWWRTPSRPHGPSDRRIKAERSERTHTPKRARQKAAAS